MAFLATPAAAHVGAYDVFYEGKAGPYALLVTVRPPPMIPGIAEIEVRSVAGDVERVDATALRVAGAGSTNAPPPDELTRSRDDGRLFTGSLWLMSSGSWQVRLGAAGARGRAETSVPVPAFARRTLRMQGTLAGILAVLLTVLSLGLVSIVGAAAREAGLTPGEPPGEGARRRGRIAMLGALAGVLLVLFLGNLWWGAEARERTELMIYRAPRMDASLEGGNLVLRVGESDWHSRRQINALVPDHGHLMHLFVAREPGLDRLYHLHPERTATGVFSQVLPQMPAGRYRLYADIVRETGFPDTMVAMLDVPDVSGGPLAGDDSAGTAPPLVEGARESDTFDFPDGGRMIRERAEVPIVAGAANELRFRVEDASGAPVTDLVPYMGMAAHAAIVKSDGRVFSHVHPTGTVSMPALMMIGKEEEGAAVDHAHMHHGGMPPVVSFPYGFPEPGLYRIFVQVKRGDRVVTGAFDIRVGGA
jgi:hypothetical protein